MPVKNLRDGTIKVQVDNDGGGNPGEVIVTLEEGNLSWTESRPVSMISDRGTLDHARRTVEDQLVELTFSVMYQDHEDPNSATPTLYEACTRKGAASAWVSQAFDTDAYAVNLEFTVTDPAGGTAEVINFDLLNFVSEDFAEGDPNTLTFTGTAPLYWVDFWWRPEDSINPRIGGNCGTFTRAGTATYINPAGEVDYARSGEFRSNHHPNSGGRTGLLEAQRTNAFTFSEDFDNAAWTKANATVSGDAVAGPDGYTTADKLVEDATAASTHLMSRAVAATTIDTDQSISIFAKVAGRTWFRIQYQNQAGGESGAFFDLTNGVVGTVAGGTARIEAAGNGWYKCSLVGDSDSGGGGEVVRFFLADADASDTYNGDGSSGVYFWAGQYEIDQPFSSSYIPTTVYPLSPDGYLEFSGAAGNYASSPDAAVLDIVGDIDLRARVAADDYTPAGTEAILGKWTTAGNQRSYLFRMETTGELALLWSTDGTALTTAESSVPTGFTNGSIHWVRATLDVSTGNVNFYTSDDGENWTLLGAADQGGAGATSIFSSTALLELGAVTTGTTANLAGKIYRAQVCDGIAGTLVFDADPQDTSTHGATRITLTEKANSAVVTTFATSSAATRVADSLYFVLPRALETPKESTWYYRLTEWVNAYISGTISHIGAATAANDPRWDLDVDASGDILANYDGGVTDADTSVVTAPSDGEQVELRTTLSAAGVVGLGSAIDNATEIVETPASGDALGAAWADDRLYVNSAGSSVTGFGNYSEIIGARRTRTLNDLRKIG